MKVSHEKKKITGKIHMPIEMQVASNLPMKIFPSPAHKEWKAAHTTYSY